MSHVCVQFGQCGNQLGNEFFSVIDDDINATNVGITGKQNTLYCLKSRDKWFRESKKSSKFFARSVLIDTESKVVKNLKRRNKSNCVWDFDKRNCISEGFGGAANNWAFGYCEQGPRIRDKSIESIRKECEECDTLQSIICLSSSAGGTGSGVGSYLTEQLRDELPNKFFMNFLVLPFKSGEVVTQNFNSLFALSKLYDKSDGIYLIENDSIHNLSVADMKIKNVTYSNINNVIAQQIASIYQPVSSFCNNITDFILDLASHNCYKILTMKSAPHTAFVNSPFDSMISWDTLTKFIEKSLRIPYEVTVQNTRCGSQNELQKRKSNYKINYYQSLGNIVIFRGSNAVVNNSEPDRNCINSNYLCSTGASIRRKVIYCCEDRKFFNKDKFITLITNNSSVSQLLDDIISKSWNMFVHNAYVHQYKKFGVENEDFLEMFLKTEAILKDYKSL